MKTWIIRYGYRDPLASVSRFYTRYHAEQFARALALNGTPYTIEEVK